MDDLVATLLEAGPVNVEELEGDHDFRFDSEWNTLACTASVDHPLAVTRASKQAVLLEQLAGFWLLRAPLFAADAEHDAAWLARHSRNLEWCYLAREHGAVWLLQFVAQEAADGALLKQLATRLGTTAGCLRISFNMPPASSYRSRTSLPSLTALNYFSPNERKVSMAKEQWEHAGRFLDLLQTWFRGAFEDVLKSLGQEASQPAMIMRPDGVLQLATEGLYGPRKSWCIL